MIGLRDVQLRALAWAGLAPLLSFGAVGVATAQAQGIQSQGIQSIVNQVCRPKILGAQANALCVQDPAQAPGGALPLTGGSVASVTPNNFNSVDFLSSSSGNSELDAVTRRLQRRRAEDRQSDLSDLSRARYASTDPKQLAAAPADEIVVGPFSLFFAARGGILDRDDSATQRGFSGNTVGGRIGGDYRVMPDLVVGAYLGYDHGDADFTGAAGNTSTDNFSGMLYGTFNATDRLYFEAAGGYVYNDYDTVRNGATQLFDPSTGLAIGTPTPFSTAGKTHGNQWLGTVGAGYEVPIGPVTVTPYARFNYVQTRINGFTETSTSLLANQVSGTTVNSITSVLGARAAYAWGMSWGVLVPQVRAEYIHEFDGGRQSSSTFTNDPTVSTLLINDAVAHDYGKVGLSMTAVLPHGLLPYLDYEALVGDPHFSQHIFTAGMRIEF
jgi:outer membrane autotransporter protein